MSHLTTKLQWVMIRRTMVLRQAREGRMLGTTQSMGMIELIQFTEQKIA